MAPQEEIKDLSEQENVLADPNQIGPLPHELLSHFVISLCYKVSIIKSLFLKI